MVSKSNYNNNMALDLWMGLKVHPSATLKIVLASVTHVCHHHAAEVTKFLIHLSVAQAIVFEFNHEWFTILGCYMIFPDLSHYVSHDVGPESCGIYCIV